MHPRTILPLTLIALVAAAGADAAEQPQEVFLVKDGKPAVYLRADEDAESRVVAACEDLARVFERITGSALPVTPAEGLVPLYVFTYDRTPIAKMNLPELDNESFHISVTPEMICLVGGGPLGAEHAVYTLLRDMGCRWIMPGEIGECLPTGGNISVALQERRESPDFEFRDIWYAYGCSPEGGQRHAQWLRRNRMYRPPIQHGHNLTNTVGVLAPFEKRPELYALIDGERQKTQICTSNAETVALVAKAIAQFCDAHPETQAYSLCPDDNTDFCSCKNCLALDSGHIDSGGEPSIADRYQVFLNGVFERLKESHPDVLLTTYSYNANHTDPPIDVRVHPNTCIFATTSVFCSAHGIGDAFCESRQDFKRLLESWTAKTEHVFI